MRVVAAMDSFKGSLTSMQAGLAVAKGFQRADPGIQVEVRPLADGGEGTVQALSEGMHGSLDHVTVTGPLGKPVCCRYGIIRDIGSDTAKAVIEMSGAAGITLVPESERNVMKSTTYGVGEVIRDAVKKGCRRFIIGIGGSATNDGGAGMLQALGWGLLDAEGRQIPWGAEGLRKLDHITDDEVLPELSACSFRIACDVTNPLCGKDGASAVFGPQKGASPGQVREMDSWLARYAAIAENYFAEKYGAACLQNGEGFKKRESRSGENSFGRQFRQVMDTAGKRGVSTVSGNRQGAKQDTAREKSRIADPDFPGSGAAGGLGFAFRTFLRGSLESGIRIVEEETHLEDAIRDADLVVTGEGRLDDQTSMGKAPVGVAKLAGKYGVPVIAFAGEVTKDAAVCNQEGIDAFFPIVRGVTTMEDAMNAENAENNLADTSEQVMRLLLMRERRRRSASSADQDNSQTADIPRTTDIPRELSDRQIYDTLIGPVCMSKTEHEAYLDAKGLL